MSVYNGKKTPQSKSGISILRSELWPLSDPDLTECTCQAEREKHFIAWAKHLCNKKQPVDYNHNTYMDTGGIWGN